MFYNLDNEIAKRETKNVYRDGNRTIKLFVEGYSKSGILNEALNQARVEEGTDLNIPKLVEITKIDNRWGLVSEHIEGTPLDQLMNKNPEKVDEYINLFVDIQLMVTSKKVPLLNKMKEKYRSRIKESNLFEDNIKYELLQRLEGMEGKTNLCHGDFVPSNIIITESGEYYVIDWAHVTQGNPEGDAATTYLRFCMYKMQELADKYLEIFCEKSKINKMNILKWIPIIAANQYLKQKPEEIETLKQWINVVEFN